MAEHGFEAATLARVVEESGIPMSSVYHYFGSKDRILLAGRYAASAGTSAPRGHPGADLPGGGWCAADAPVHAGAYPYRYFGCQQKADRRST